MVVNERIKEQFGTWLSSYQKFIESEEMDKIYAFLKQESGKGKVICPKSVNTFKSLELCDKSKLKAVIVLMDPYPTMKDKIMVSDGVPMSCKNTGVIQSSLSMWYHGIEHNYGFNPDMDISPDIDYLLKEEHVLLINSALSVELNKSGSHAQVWQPFMKELFRILNEEHRGLPIVLCGTAAQKYEKEINPLLHYIKKVEHPVAASYANRAWNNEYMFKWIDNILESNNGKSYKVNWYRLKKSAQEKSSYKGVSHETIECLDCPF